MRRGTRAETKHNDKTSHSRQAPARQANSRIQDPESAPGKAEQNKKQETNEGSIADSVGHAEATGNRNELAHPSHTGQRILLIEQRVDRRNQLRTIMKRQTPICISEPSRKRVKRKSETPDIELHAGDRATTTHVELEPQDLTQRPQAKHRRNLPPTHVRNEVRTPNRLN